MPHLSAKNRVDSKSSNKTNAFASDCFFFGDFPKNFQVGASKGWFPIMESAFPATYFCSFHVPFFWAMCFGGPRTTFLKSHAGAKTCWPSSRRISNRRCWCFFFGFRSNARGFKVIWRMDPYHGLGWTRMFLGFLGICCRSSLGPFVHYLFLGNDTWHKIERCPIRLFWSFLSRHARGCTKTHTG